MQFRKLRAKLWALQDLVGEQTLEEELFPEDHLSVSDGDDDPDPGGSSSGQAVAAKAAAEEPKKRKGVLRPPRTHKTFPQQPTTALPGASSSGHAVAAKAAAAPKAKDITTFTVVMAHDTEGDGRTKVVIIPKFSGKGCRPSKANPTATFWVAAGDSCDKKKDIAVKVLDRILKAHVSKP